MLPQLSCHDIDDYFNALESPSLIPDTACMHCMFSIGNLSRLLRINSNFSKAVAFLCTTYCLCTYVDNEQQPHDGLNENANESKAES